MAPKTSASTREQHARDGLTVTLSNPPTTWERLGIIMEHGPAGSFDMSVIGDPCVVWDQEIQRYRMFYFGQAHAADGSEINENCVAISTSSRSVWRGDWEKKGILSYTNKEVIGTNGHKAFIVCDPFRPNTPVRIDGRFWFFQSVYSGHNKQIMLATAESLGGPWTNHEQPVIELGPEDAFDGYNCDSPTAYWFEDQQKVLIYYKGYPARPQADQPASPLGSTPAAAVMAPGDSTATKLGKILELPQTPGHWASGWMSTPQIVRAADGGWFGMANGSKTSPAPVEEEPAMREPLPSNGGWMYTAEEFPVSGWKVFEKPFEWIPEAMRNGEGESYWKHGFLFQEDGSLTLYYHAGNYGKEYLYAQRAHKVFEPRWE